MTKQRYERSWDSIIRAMNIEAGAKMYRNAIIEPVLDVNLSPYYLRHTYATNLAEMGVNLRTAQYLLGHANMNTTAKVYTHVTNKMLDTAREKINTNHHALS